jgi:hypothetical protein
MHVTVNQNKLVERRSASKTSSGTPFRVNLTPDPPVIHVEEEGAGVVAELRPSEQRLKLSDEHVSVCGRHGPKELEQLRVNLPVHLHHECSRSRDVFSVKIGMLSTEQSRSTK